VSPPRGCPDCAVSGVFDAAPAYGSRQLPKRDGEQQMFDGPGVLADDLAVRPSSPQRYVGLERALVVREEIVPGGSLGLIVLAQRGSALLRCRYVVVPLLPCGRLPPRPGIRSRRGFLRFCFCVVAVRNRLFAVRRYELAF